MLALEELAECLTYEMGVEDAAIANELGKCIREFVRQLPVREGDVFVRRYFFTEPIVEIAKNYGLTVNYTTVMLSRTRKKLKQHLIEEAYDNWRASVEAQRQKEGYANGLEAFWEKSIQQFLSGSNGENIAYSPINVYMALGMLAELTDGNSRQQVLDLMQADSIESLRTQAKAVWNAHYRNDGATTSILASSLWLNEDVAFVPDTMKNLTKNYYASSFQGKMGSKEFNQALQTWLNEQTGGLLKRQVQGIELDRETVLALTTTIYYRAKWSSEFREMNNTTDMFHTATGDVDCEFMNSSWQDNYYWGDKFGAVGKRLENDGGTMWFLLPDEGISAEELLKQSETMEFILSNGKWENSKRLIVNLSLPKFDISSQIRLEKGLQSLGITDVFDDEVSDFTSMTTQTDNIYVSDTLHGVRVAIDEEGVTAAAYTVMKEAGSAMPPEEEMDFVLDRPFLFAITSNDGLPLFVGVVNNPN